MRVWNAGGDGTFSLIPRNDTSLTSSQELCNSVFHTHFYASARIVTSAIHSSKRRCHSRVSAVHRPWLSTAPPGCAEWMVITPLPVFHGSILQQRCRPLWHTSHSQCQMSPSHMCPFCDNLGKKDGSAKMLASSPG